MEKKKGISGSTLKMIAIVTMLIDHIGAAVLARLLMVNGLGAVSYTHLDVYKRQGIIRCKKFLYCAL